MDATPVKIHDGRARVRGRHRDDAGVIATSSAVPNAAVGPLRCNVNVAVVTDGALSSRLKPTVIEAGSASTVEFGAGDNDVTRIGPDARGARLCAVGDPLPNDVDVGLRHGRQAGRHALADTRPCLRASG